MTRKVKRILELEMDNSNNWLPFKVMCSPSLEVGLPG